MSEALLHTDPLSPDEELILHVQPGPADFALMLGLMALAMVVLSVALKAILGTDTAVLPGVIGGLLGGGLVLWLRRPRDVQLTNRRLLVTRSGNKTQSIPLEQITSVKTHPFGVTILGPKPKIDLSPMRNRRRVARIIRETLPK